MPKNNKSNFILKLLICCMIFLLPFIFQGCVSSHLSKDYGKSYEAMLYAQAVNPDGPEDGTHVDECPGPVAEGIYEIYLKTFGGEDFAQQLGEMILNN